MNDVKQSGFAAPGPDNFDFDSYIAGRSTFPKFQHTVYLDQQRGIELASAIEEYDRLAGRHSYLDLKRSQALEGGGLGLVDEGFTSMVEEIDEIEGRLKDIEVRIDQLQSEIQQTSITLHLQANTPQKFTSVVRKAEKAYLKKNGKVDDEDIEHVTGKMRNVLIAWLVNYCIGVTTPDGSNHPAPNEASFTSLVDSLIASENLRLFTAVQQGLDASGKWAERIDAGFPGRGADVGGVPVGGAGAEGGSVLESPSAGDADREEDFMV